MFKKISNLFAKRRLKQQPGTITSGLWNSQFFGGEDFPSSIWCPEDMLRIATAFRCVKVISGAISSLPWHVIRTTGGGSKIETYHPLARLLSKSPNPEMSAKNFRRSLIMRMLLYGNGYAEIIRDGMGKPVELWPIDPWRVQPERDQSGGLAYKISAPSGDFQYVRPRDILHLADAELDGIVGHGIFDVAYGPMLTAMRAERWAGAYFKNAMQPPGVLQVPQDVELSRQARAAMLDAWREVSGSDATGLHTPFIADQGMTYSAISHTPEQAQMIETRKFHVREICRWFGVPPYLVYADDEEARASTEAQANEFRTFTLDPIINELEQEADRKLILYPETFHTRIDTTRMVRGDMMTRVQYYKELRNMGVATVNDVLRWEGKDTIGTEGDHRVMQVQYQPVDPNTGAPMAPQMQYSGAGMPGEAGTTTGTTSGTGSENTEDSGSENTEDSGEVIPMRRK